MIADEKLEIIFTLYLKHLQNCDLNINVKNCEKFLNINENLIKYPIFKKFIKKEKKFLNKLEIKFKSFNSFNKLPNNINSFQISIVNYLISSLLKFSDFDFGFNRNDFFLFYFEKPTKGNFTLSTEMNIAIMVCNLKLYEEKQLDTNKLLLILEGKFIKIKFAQKLLKKIKKFIV